MLRISIKQSTTPNIEKKDLSEYKLVLTKQHNAKPFTRGVVLGYVNVSFVLRAWQLIILLSWQAVARFQLEFDYHTGYFMLKQMLKYYREQVKRVIKITRSLKYKI